MKKNTEKTTDTEVKVTVDVNKLADLMMERFGFGTPWLKYAAMTSASYAAGFATAYAFVLGG